MKLELSLKMKNATESFKEGFEPGVLLVKEVELELPENVSGFLLGGKILRLKKELIEEEVEILVKEIS